MGLLKEINISIENERDYKCNYSSQQVETASQSKRKGAIS